LVDKILNMVQHVQLQFKDDIAFSKEFYVVANDVEKATCAMTAPFRQALRDIKIDDFIIEIVGNTLIIGNVQLVNPHQTVYLADFASKLSMIK